MNPITTFGRERVLNVLQESLQPLANVEVSRLAGLPLQQARNRLAGLIREKLVVNVGTKNNSRYTVVNRGAMTVTAPADESPSAIHWREAGSYTGEKSLPVRPGSMEFLKAPSLVDGKRVERKRPILICAQPEKKA